jgi:hypothetical protein
MTTSVPVAISLLGAVFLVPVQGQNHEFSFNLGGGITTPLNPTGAYAGVSGNFVAGAGYKINSKNAIIAELMWSGLPSNLFVVSPIRLPHSRINLYSLTVNYRRQADHINGSPFGLYVIGGGGWYYRYAVLEKDFIVPAGTPCQPYWEWWGYGCYGPYVYSQDVASKGVGAGGFNAGAGFTIRFSDSNVVFYTEARYHYAFSERIRTTVLPVTFGIRYN